MKKILMILLFLASASVYAQRITITGTVSDEKGAPLPGSTVQLKGSTVGGLTDLEFKPCILFCGLYPKGSSGIESDSNKRDTSGGCSGS